MTSGFVNKADGLLLGLCPAESIPTTQWGVILPSRCGFPTRHIRSMHPGGSFAHPLGFLERICHRIESHQASRSSDFGAGAEASKRFGISLRTNSKAFTDTPLWVRVFASSKSHNSTASLCFCSRASRSRSRACSRSRLRLCSFSAESFSRSAAIRFSVAAICSSSRAMKCQLLTGSHHRTRTRVAYRCDPICPRACQTHAVRYEGSPDRFASRCDQSVSEQSRNRNSVSGQ